MSFSNHDVCWADEISETSHWQSVKRTCIIFSHDACCADDIPETGHWPTADVPGCGWECQDPCQWGELCVVWYLPTAPLGPFSTAVLCHTDIPTYRHTQSHIYGCTLTSPTHYTTLHYTMLHHTYTHTHTTHTCTYACMHTHHPPLAPQTHKLHFHAANNQFPSTAHSLQHHMPQCFSNP